MLVATVGPFAKYGDGRGARGDRRRRDLPGLHGRAGVHPPRLRAVRRPGAQERRRAADRAGLRLGAGRARRPRWRSRTPAPTPCASTSATSSAARRPAPAPRSRSSARRSTPASASATARIVTERGAARVRSFGSDAGQAFSAGGAEHFTLPLAYPRAARGQHLPRAPGRSRAASSSPRVATSLAQRLPGSRAVMQAAGERVVAAAARPRRRAAPPRASSRPPTPPTATQLGAHRARRPRPVRLHAPASWPGPPRAAAGVEGTGALSPVLAFGGLAGLHEGCARRGHLRAPVARTPGDVRLPHAAPRADASPAPPTRSSRSSPTPATSRRSRRPGCASAIVTPRPIEMGAGTLIEYRLRLHGLPISWLTRIEVWEPGVRFVDQQLRGPYALWHHTHEFEPDARRRHADARHRPLRAAVRPAGRARPPRCSSAATSSGSSTSARERGRPRGYRVRAIELGRDPSGGRRGLATAARARCASCWSRTTRATR